MTAQVTYIRERRRAGSTRLAPRDPASECSGGCGNPLDGRHAHDPATGLRYHVECWLLAMRLVSS